MLGHVNGLPWYDLFAPLGKADKTYSIEEAKQYLIDTFTKLTPEMADLMREAFENEISTREKEKRAVLSAREPCG